MKGRSEYDLRMSKGASPDDNTYDMTAPDVAALAAALHAHGDCPLCNDEASRIIAALAAQGWRITSAPEGSDEASSPASGEAKSEVVTADDPVSAQAAPDMPPTKRIGDYSVLVDGLPDRVAQAAVRATLEGLRAEMMDLTSFGDPAGGPRLHRAAIRAIDARLAALDD